MRWLRHWLATLLVLAWPLTAHAVIENNYNIVIQNAVTANGNGTTLATYGYASMGIQVTISGTATVTFKASADNQVTFNALTCIQDDFTTTANNTTSSAAYTCNLSGKDHFQAVVSGCAGCTVTVTVNLLAGGTARLGGGGGSSKPCTTTALSLQYNNAGAFGCISGATSNGTNIKTNTLLDANGNSFLAVSATASAVDALTITNAATGSPATVKLGATGTDANITMELDPKGSGVINIGTGVSGHLGLGDISVTNEAAPATPASGLTKVYVDLTSKNLAAINDAGTINHGIQTKDCTGTGHMLSLSDAGVVTCSADAGGSTRLDQILAATATNTILNSTFAQLWKWAPTADSTTQFTYTESAAATGGTVTAGIPNQVLLKISTLAASTESPIEVLVRGTFAFGADNANARELFADGTVTNPHAFASNLGLGFYKASADEFDLADQGLKIFGAGISGGVGYAILSGGSATLPGLGDLGSVSGLSWSISSKSLSVLNNNLETFRFDTTGRFYVKAQTSVPTMGTCGTSPSVVGTDNVMVVTVGTGTVTSCAVNFGSAYLTNAPVCVAQDASTLTNEAASMTTLAVTVTSTASIGGTTLQILCFGRL